LLPFINNTTLLVEIIFSNRSLVASSKVGKLPPAKAKPVVLKLADALDILTSEKWECTAVLNRKETVAAKMTINIKILQAKIMLC
jgi:hypothetical protein